MDLLRTPDERFVGLPGYDFTPRYLETDDGLRVHYVDEGTGDVVLLLHGEPSWSYLYRKMIPPLVDAGFRVVAPDLVGFGRSDKPASRHDYTYERHVAWMRSAIIEGLDLRGITLVGQDWGGLIGLRLAAEHEDRFARIVAANTGLPTGDQRLGEAFMAWRQFSQDVPVFPAGRIVAGGCAMPVSDEVIAAYDAPFPDEAFKEAARQFPVLVPAAPDDPAASANRAAWEVLTTWEKPFLCAFSDNDPITKGGERVFLERVPGTAGQPHTTIEGGGHFLQEDKGEELARVVTAWN
ncbi:MAG: haloalkane dehalogenase [Actinobacteria bacterium]|nr:haloalkane dehalogenase [Actinomycetota bacterium]